MGQAVGCRAAVSSLACAAPAGVVGSAYALRRWLWLRLRPWAGQDEKADVAVALPEDNAARLSWLHETRLSSLNWESDAEEVSYLLLVDYDFPPELHDHLDWAPPTRMKVGKGLYGPRTADMAERLGLSPSPCEKLVPFLGTHVEEGVDGKRLKFLRDVLGARVWRLHRLRLQPLHGGLHGAQAQHSERRQLKTGSVVAEKVVHPERHLRPLLREPRQVQEHERLRGPAKFERAVGKSPVTNFELQINDSEGFLAFVETLKTDRSKACVSVPTQVGAHAAALQGHDGEGLLPPHEEALPEDEAALHGHQLRDGADLRAAGPAPRHGRGEPAP